MEILANNGRIVAADDMGNVCLSETFEDENGVVCTTYSTPGANNIEVLGLLRLEDESMIVNSKKRAFDEESKDLQSPAKKLAVRSSSRL